MAVWDLSYRGANAFGDVGLIPLESNGIYFYTEICLFFSYILSDMVEHGILT